MKIATRLVLPILVLVMVAAGSAPTSARASASAKATADKSADERQAGPLSIDTLMATPFPTDLVAAPSGGRIAWVSSNSGVHNILVAEPGPPTKNTMGNPDHKWRAVTSYQGD